MYSLEYSSDTCCFMQIIKISCLHPAAEVRIIHDDAKSCRTSVHQFKSPGSF